MGDTDPMTTPTGGAALCELCGDIYHAEPDPPEMSWMGLICPGADASQEAKDAYRHQLCNVLAEEVRKQAILTLEADDAYLSRRHGDWKARQRSDGKVKDQMSTRAQVSVALKDDCDQRTDAEVGRQKSERVFQTPEFEIEVPHLAVPVSALSSQKGVEERKIERSALVKPGMLDKDKRDKDTDFMLYQSDDE